MSSISFRYTQPPKDLLSWYEDYLDDEEVSQVVLSNAFKDFLKVWAETQRP